MVNFRLNNMSIGRVVIFLILVCGMLPLEMAQAAEPGFLRVTDTDGIASGTCGNLADWSNACTLQNALNNIAVSGDEIWVKTGTYKPTTGNDRSVSFQLKTGISLYGGFSGSETNLTQRDPEINITTLSGDIGLTGNDGDNSYHVVVGSGTDRSAVLDGFTISDGNANGYGAGMYNSGGSPTITNVIFSNNYSDWFGGGIYNDGSPALTNVIFIDNTSAANGGGMYSNKGSPVLLNVTFKDNSTLFHHGGGMYNLSGSPILNNVTFVNNSAAEYGGGFYNSAASSNLSNITVTGNSAIYGGGVCIGGGIVNLNNLTVIHNTASYLGGGMFNSSNSILTMTNSIVWDNTAPNDPQMYNDGKKHAFTYNDIQGGYEGAGNLEIDPFLGELSNNGGFTQTIPLLPGSGVIDAGDDETCSDKDQRGVDRPSGAHCDMGAYETRGFTLVKTGGDNQNTFVNLPFTNPLQVTLSETDGNELSGVPITFTTPEENASAVITGSPATTDQNGTVTVNATANDIPGSYAMIASTQDTSVFTEFSLENKSISIVERISGTITIGGVKTAGTQVGLKTGAITNSNNDGFYTFDNIPSDKVQSIYPQDGRYTFTPLSYENIIVPPGGQITDMDFSAPADMNKVVLSSPLNGSVSSRTSVILKWNVSGARRYQVTITNLTTGKPHVIYTLRPQYWLTIRPYTSYSWKVTAYSDKKAKKEIGTSTTWYVFAPYPPAVPRLLLPQQNQKNVSRMPTLTWANSRSNLPVDHYVLQLKLLFGKWKEVSVVDGSFSPLQYIVSEPLLPNTTYLWRVKACNDVIPNQCSNWSVVKKFTTGID